MKTHFDVAVVGGGLAGLLLADRLADHCELIRIDGTSHPFAPATMRSLGICARGGMDSPARLKHALGDQAEALWAFSGRSVDGLIQCARELAVSAHDRGSRRVSLGAEEWREWEASATLLQRWGVDSRVLTADELSAVGVGFDGGVHIDGDGIVDVGALLQALEARLVGRAEHQENNGRITATLGGVSIETVDGPITAEVAVVAAGARSAEVHPWFGPVIVPVRLQGLYVRGGPAQPFPVLARHRFEAWASDPSGFGFVGCRWAEQPEMEAGVTDDRNTSDRVEAKSREFLAEHLPTVDLSDAHAFSGIAGFSCDGLPFVGPLPGEPRVHALCGWGGWGLSWIHAAVEQVAGAILGEEADIPSALLPRRMV